MLCFEAYVDANYTCKTTVYYTGMEEQGSVLTVLPGAVRFKSLTSLVIEIIRLVSY